MGQFFSPGISPDNFVDFCKFSQDDQIQINEATLGQHKNESWHQMRHLMVTGKKIKALYTRQKTLERKPDMDVSTTVSNFMKESQLFTKFPESIEYGLQNEEHAKFYYSKIYGKKHNSFQLEQCGLLVSLEYPWLGASLDGIRKCSCCPENVLVEFKCPFNGKDLHPKSAFLLDSVGGMNKDGHDYLHENHIHYFQIQTGMAVAGLKKCDFVTFTSEGIHVVEIPFNRIFWESVVRKVELFYMNQIIPKIFNNFSTKNGCSSSPQKSVSPATPEMSGEFNSILSGDSDDQISNDIYSTPSTTNTPHESLSDIESFLSTSDSGSDVELCDPEPDNIDLNEIITFAKASETVHALKTFIQSGCGDVNKFHPKLVEKDTVDLLSRLSGDDHDSLLDEITTLHPELRDNWSVSKCLSVIHKLVTLFLENKCT